MCEHVEKLNTLSSETHMCPSMCPYMCPSMRPYMRPSMCPYMRPSMCPYMRPHVSFYCHTCVLMCEHVESYCIVERERERERERVE